MRTKISIEIHKAGSENDVLTRMVATVNEGRAQISMGEIAAYLNVRNAIYPTIHKFASMPEDGSLLISEDGGKTYTITLTWKEVHELSDTEKEIQQELETADDIKNVNI